MPAPSRASPARTEGAELPEPASHGLGGDAEVRRGRLASRGHPLARRGPLAVRQPGRELVTREEQRRHAAVRLPLPPLALVAGPRHPNGPAQLAARGEAAEE